MPELPEVETVRLGLIGVLVGKRIVSAVARRPDLRVALPPDFARRLEGRRVEALERRAKYLLVKLDDGWTWIVHLGMSGRMTTGRVGTLPPIDRHDHVVVVTEGDMEVRFRDPRRFGLMTLVRDEDMDRHPLLAGLGPEPLTADFNGAMLAAALKGRRTPIKAALLDQRIVSGLGNIYVCESLFRAGISPRLAASGLQRKQVERLHQSLRNVLSEAIDTGLKASLDFAGGTDGLFYFGNNSGTTTSSERFLVYGRRNQPCFQCGTPVVQYQQAGRSTYDCPTCQAEGKLKL